jgi:hypothetical protein
MMNGGESGRTYPHIFTYVQKNSGYKSKIGRGRMDLLYNHTCKYDTWTIDMNNQSFWERKLQTSGHTIHLLHPYRSLKGERSLIGSDCFCNQGHIGVTKPGNKK